ncbi:MAG: cbb3 [Fibrobacteres bacterium]|nr:cbb3 [Fibrobacterota bacterium]
MKSLYRTALALAVPALVSALLGCRGQTTEKTPIWIKHGMEFQPKMLPYGQNNIFPDGRNMQHPPEGTVAVGLLKQDDVYYRGGQDTAHYAANPMKIDAMLLDRGQERFQIYCAPCHGRTGAGNGIVIAHGFPVPPPNFHDDRVVAFADGYIFNVITHGVRNMPSYGKQVPEEDRWAIVAYLRALQRTTHATVNDVPESERANLK